MRDDFMKPDMRDCKLIVRTPDATCYVMDTYCRNVTLEQRIELEKQIAQAYVRNAMRTQAAAAPQKAAPEEDRNL